MAMRINSYKFKQYFHGEKVFMCFIISCEARIQREYSSNPTIKSPFISQGIFAAGQTAIEFAVVD